MGIRRIMVTVLATLIAFSLTGCGGKNQVIPNSIQRNLTNPLSDLAAKAKDIPGMSFEVSVTINGNPTAKSKVWVNGKNSRTEITSDKLTSVIIVNQEGYFYSFAPNSNVAFLEANDPLQKSPADYLPLYGGVNFNGQVLEPDTYEKQPCRVIRLNDPILGELRMWIREDLGLPVKIEATNNGNLLTTEFQKLEVGPQSDKLFELPPGMKIKTASDN